MHGPERAPEMLQRIPGAVAAASGTVMETMEQPEDQVLYGSAGLIRGNAK